jgi:hypothetical protein
LLTNKQGSALLNCCHCLQIQVHLQFLSIRKHAPCVCLQVQTIERYSRSLRVVGFALLPLFLDPTTGSQPVSRSIQDYVLNQGAFQVRKLNQAAPDGCPYDRQS